MSDLVEFLLARIAEDAAAARHVIEIRERYMPDAPVVIDYQWVEFMAPAAHPGNRSSMFFDGAPSPHRVLAECEARRRIIEWYGVSEEREMPSDAWVLMVHVLRELALPYWDHPDYRGDWRPGDL